MATPEESGWTRRSLARWLGKNWARLSYSYLVEPVWLESNRLEIAVPDLPAELDGLSVLHLTDFHLSHHVPASHLKQAIELGRRQHCDIVALTGDFVHAGFRYVTSIAELLARLKAPLGTYAVLGNHDYSVRNALGVRRYPKLPEAVAEALREVGIDVLHNEHRLVERNGVKFAVAGAADLWSRETDLPGALDGIPEETPRLVLAHNPRSLRQLGGRRCDLMLSGHTHGGQVHLPTLGSPIPASMSHHFAAGLYYHDSGYLYVNKGVGYTVRFRFGVRPEIAVLKFRPARLDVL